VSFGLPQQLPPPSPPPYNKVALPNILQIHSYCRIILILVKQRIVDVWGCPCQVCLILKIFTIAYSINLSFALLFTINGGFIALWGHREE